MEKPWFFVSWPECHLASQLRSQLLAHTSSLQRKAAALGVIWDTFPGETTTKVLQVQARSVDKSVALLLQREAGDKALLKYLLSLT